MLTKDFYSESETLTFIGSKFVIGRVVFGLFCCFIFGDELMWALNWLSEDELIWFACMSSEDKLIWAANWLSEDELKWAVGWLSEDELLWRLLVLKKDEGEISGGCCFFLAG